jgi:dolichyl-phosphate-mannose--protein O-mannosyl transferase
MLAVSQIDRVMYLYHYFLPLLFSFLVTATAFMEMQHIGNWKLTDVRKNVMLLLLSVCIFSSYVFYSPFSYYRPIGNEQVMQRAIFPLWELHCVGCEKESILTEKMCK